MRTVRRSLTVLLLIAAAALVPAAAANALNNGLALTPPMGWNDWNTFGCNVSAQLVEQTAQFMVSSGMQAAGYRAHRRSVDSKLGPKRSSIGFDRGLWAPRRR